MKDRVREFVAAFLKWKEVPQERVEEPPVEEPLVQVHHDMTLARPPIFIRIYGPHEDANAETNRQFIDWGWRRGVNSHPLEQAENCMKAARHPMYAEVVANFKRPWPDGFVIRLQSSLEHRVEGIKYAGKRYVFMYFPADELVMGACFPTTAVFGGPSDGVVELVRAVAMMMSLRIRILDCDEHGGVLAVFSTHDATVQLPDLLGVADSKVRP